MRFFYVCIFGLLFLSLPANGQQVRKIVSIDKGWKFQLGEVNNGQLSTFDDSNWRIMDVPHDWSIEGDYDQNHTTKRGGGYLPAGIGWYRKAIVVPKSDAGKRIFIEFGGVMANSDVWINGHLLGHRPFGYLPLLYDMTDYLSFDGKPNTIAVRADNTVQPASRWYTGAGIYRHVNLITVDRVHLDRWGVFIFTPEVSAQKASVTIQASVTNQSSGNQKIFLQTTITSHLGKILKSEPTPVTVNAGQTVQCEQVISVANPELWDIETPNIYTAVTTVTAAGKIIDDQKNTFGIRDIRFEAETGFWLNGKNIKILGACAHHDGGAVGSAVPASVWERRIEHLKQIGCNALRGAHCPMDPAFYDLCDKMGMLLMDETFDTWTAAKPNGEKAYNLYFNDWWKIDTRAQILRVRNHPSIILYSLGNEIRDDLNSDEGRQRFLNLRSVTKELDPTRPVTMALFRPVQMKLFENGFSELLDVIGQNYGENGLLAVRDTKPERKIIGTENTPSRSAWLALRNNPAMSGEFVWTSFDYLGEADWPQVSWNTGLFDRNGGWKPSSWERQSWWTKAPMVHIVRRADNGKGLTNNWTILSDTIQTVSVFVYSNCEEVELYLNGHSLGKQAVPEDNAPNQWEVDFLPGTIKVIGRNGGKEVAVHEQITASEPTKLILTTEKKELINDWEEVVYVTATVADKNGIRFPNSNHQVKFSISGPGEIISVDNSNTHSHERYKTDRKTVFEGEVLAIIRATASSGIIKVTVSADGLESASVLIDAVAKKSADFDQLPRTNRLPDPFLFFDGNPVAMTPEGWKVRRTEIVQLFEKYVTGTFPPKPSIGKIELIDETKGIGYTIRNMRVLFGPQNKGSVRIRLVIPNRMNGEKFPVLICPNLDGWASSLIRRGYISAGYAGNDRMDDSETLKAIYPDYDFATLSRRAWLAQIVVDYLETVPQVDKKHIAIFGYSRDGKMATYAAALDERISALIAGSTGVGGAVPWRFAGERGGGEGIESTTRMFPDWFIPSFRSFAGHEDRLPVDANLLMALVAPRAALFEWGLNDQVANGWAMEQAYLSAQKVYEVLEQPTRLNLMRVPGFHGSNDQEACIDFLDIQFGRSDKKWKYDFVFPWNFDDWRALSGEKIDLTKYHPYPSHDSTQLHKSITWMLGDTPPVLPKSGGASEIPGPTTVAQGNAGNPGQLAPDVPAWVISQTSPEYGWLAPERNEIDSRRIRFGSDNVTGDLYFPKNIPEGIKLPTVIWLHGYHYPLGYMWVYRHYLHPILALVKAGYAVFAFDQTGFGMRTNEAATFYNRYPHWSRLGKMVEDVSNSIDALQKESIVDASNISLFGYTLGGTVGLYAAALDQRISGVVSICGFTPMRTDTARYSHLYGLTPRLGFFAGNESHLPYDFENIISLIAPRPVLIVQPTMDREVNSGEVKTTVEQAKTVYNLNGAGDKLELYAPDDYARLTTVMQNNSIEWMKNNIKNRQQ